MAEQFALYHGCRPRRPGRRCRATPAELAKLIDFHQALAMLAAHPNLLTATGLVLAVEIPGLALPGSRRQAAATSPCR